MDGIVKEIYESITNNPAMASTLLVLCGDHGMNDAGNHGGSSAGETSPALVFASPKMRQLGRRFDAPASPQSENEFAFFQTIEQSDIAPTLAALLGFPVPQNNLGTLVVDFLDFWPSGKSPAPFTQPLMGRLEGEPEVACS